MNKKHRETTGKISYWQKRSDARIFILAYKPTPYKLPNSPLYTVIHCGAEPHRFKYRFGTPDDMGEDNISRYNNVYCDLTGTYWIWKHRPDSLRYVGTCQYSKLLKFVSDTNFDNIFNEYDACAVSLLATKNAIPTTVYNQFCNWHPKEIIDMVEDIIKEKYPEYADAWEKYVKQGSIIYYSNGVIMRSADFDKYCELFFGICDEIIKRYGATKDTIFDVFKKKFDSGEWVNHFYGRGDTYHCLLFGFLNERIMTMFLRNLGKIKELEYTHMPHV